MSTPDTSSSADASLSGEQTTLRVPAHCTAGHLLEPRTTYVRSKADDPLGWTCIVCLRADVYRRHHGSPLPVEMCSPECFATQSEVAKAVYRRKPLPAFTRAVHFESGVQFSDCTDARRPTSAA